MRIVLSGPPSVGKSTQGRALAGWLDVPHVSSGALIRQQAAAGDPTAQRLFEAVSDGSLAPSDEIVSLVMQRLDQPDCQRGFILDGFPRKAVEAEALLARLADTPLDAFLVLRASARALQTRVEERARQASLVRSDDDPEVFPRRIAVYERETVKVREIMRRHEVNTFSVNAEGAAEDVTRSIRRALEPYLLPLETDDQIRLAV